MKISPRGSVMNSGNALTASWAFSLMWIFRAEIVTFILHCIQLTPVTRSETDEHTKNYPYCSFISTSAVWTRQPDISVHTDAAYRSNIAMSGRVWWFVDFLLPGLLHRGHFPTILLTNPKTQLPCHNLATSLPDLHTSTTVTEVFGGTQTNRDIISEDVPVKHNPKKTTIYGIKS